MAKKYRIKVEVSVAELHDEKINKYIYFGESEQAIVLDANYSTLMYVNWTDLVWNNLIGPALDAIKDNTDKIW